MHTKQVSVGRAVVALLKAASVKQLAVLGLVVLGSVLVLFDVLAGDPPSAKPEPVEPALGGEPRGLLAQVIGQPEFVWFAGLCVLSIGFLVGMLFLFWRHVHRSG
jgi:hypothetical protein